MNLVVSVEHRFEQTPDGAVWTQTQFARPSWEPYLRVFDSLRVVARVRPVEAPTDGWVRSDGDRVAFAPVPYFVGPLQYLAQRRAVRQAAANAVGPDDAIVLRVPSTLWPAVSNRNSIARGTRSASRSSAIRTTSSRRERTAICWRPCSAGTSRGVCGRSAAMRLGPPT